jgi:hypothetical protein
MKIIPLSFAQACEFVGSHHRHHRRPQGHKYSIGLKIDNSLVGVAIVGRPVARALDDGLTCEVTRLCTDGTPNAASKLYGAARRIAIAMGYEKVLTYTLASEPGTSLIAAGWRSDGMSAGGSWTRPCRSREDKHPLTAKRRWIAPIEAPN